MTAALVVTPTIVTRGTQALLQVDVTNPGANTATVDLDRGNTRVSFGFGQYSAYLQPGSPTQILPGQTVRLSFEDKLVPTALTAGPYNLTVDLAYTANNFDKTEVETVTNGITVQDPPSFSITGIAASQGSATAGQTMSWLATMTILNNGVTPIDLNFASNKTYIQFVVPGGGFDTNYIVTPPTSMVGGATQLGPNATGQIEFIVTKTGNVTGVIVISGRVEGTDGAAIVFDDTFDGGRGSISVVPAAAVTVLATHTSQPLVTQSQAADWTARVVVANTGGADVDLNLATSHIDFAGPQAGWSVGTPILAGGGSTLEGGSVDSLLFTVLTTGSTTGPHRIDATVPWQDINTSAIDSAVTTSGGFGSITVETPVAIRITTTTSQSPNPNAVNRGKAFDVRIQVQNTGQADARDVVIGMTRSGSSTILPIAPITEVIGGQTVAYDLGVVAANASNLGETFTTSITSATDENSGAAVTPKAAVDSLAIVAIQSPAELQIQNVRPSRPTVTRGQTTPFWTVIAYVANNGEAGAVLTPAAANDLSFSIGGSNQTDFVVQPPTALGSGGWSLAGGAIDSLIYTVTVTGGTAGTVDIGVAADGTDRNDPTLALNDVGGTSVQVQDPAGLAITTTVPVGTVNHASADRDTVNTSFAYEIHVTVDNTGGEAVDSVLVQLKSNLLTAPFSVVAPASLRRQQIGVGGSATFIYNITAPANPVALETFTSTILAGAKSHNTGQPITPQQPADNVHVVVTQRPADLVMNLTSASASVSTNQVFTMSATVTNAGQASVSGAGSLTLTLPGGFALQNSGAEPPLRTFAVGVPVTWQVVAPAAAQASANFGCDLTTRPNDRNTDLVGECLATERSIRRGGGVGWCLHVAHTRNRDTRRCRRRDGERGADAVVEQQHYRDHHHGQHRRDVECARRLLDRGIADAQLGSGNRSAASRQSGLRRDCTGQRRCGRRLRHLHRRRSEYVATGADQRRHRLGDDGRARRTDGECQRDGTAGSDR